MKLSITGYSTALFSTWYFIEELGLLFDAGDGLTASLLHKCGKINHVFISHADRDHLTGLLQFNQLYARPGAPKIYYPKDCRSFPALESFSKLFDPHVSGTVWEPIVEGTQIKIREDVYVEALRNGHVAATSDISKSLSYKVFQTKRKLKPELEHLSKPELQKMVEAQGRERITMEIKTCILGYSGDTPVEDLQRWNDTKILIHEATFLGGEDDANIQTHGNKHSTLEEVMTMVSQSNIETLIFGHFSSRYSPTQIDTKIKQLCQHYEIKIPVFRVLPGEVCKDILNGEMVN